MWLLPTLQLNILNSSQNTPDLTKWEEKVLEINTLGERVQCRNTVLPRGFLTNFLSYIPTTVEQCHKPLKFLTAAERVMIVIKEIKIF